MYSTDVLDPSDPDIIAHGIFDHWLHPHSVEVIGQNELNAAELVSIDGNCHSIGSKVKTRVPQVWKSEPVAGR